MADARWSLNFAWGRAPYALDLPEVVIGRGDTCSLQIDEPSAALEHARLIVDDDDHVWLEDLGSGQPTLINGRTVSGRTPLSDGDFVQIGHAVLTVRQNASAPKPRVRSERGEGLATVMMESPLVRPPDAVTAAMPVVSPTVTMTAPSSAPTVTMEAVNDGKTATMTAVDGAKTMSMTAASGSPTVTMAAQETETQPSIRAAQRTVEVDAASVLSSVRVEREHQGPRQTILGVGPAELAVAPTMIGAMPQAPAAQTAPMPTAEIPTAIPTSSQSSNRRRDSLADITPLPAPLPPAASVPNLEPLVKAAAAKLESQAARDKGYDIGTEPTQLPRELPPEVADLHAAKTQAPVEVPPEVALHRQKTQAPMPAPKSASLHSMRTETTRAMPPEAGTQRAPTTRVEPLPPPPAYVPPTKGPFGAFSRALDFFSQMMAASRQAPALRRPIYANLAIATPVSLLVSASLIVLRSPRAIYAVLGAGTALLYFIDYLCNAMTASLVYDHAITGRIDPAAARARVKKALPGILTFAAVSALLDVASTYARERRDLLSKILLGVLRAIWTTATYVILPALVIEGVSFKEAFARSRAYMDRDPTGAGAGIVALSLCSYVIAAVCFWCAYFFMGLGARIHPSLGALLFFTFVNTYWAVSGWMKIAYSTYFYVWAQSCEAVGRGDVELAPAPLRHAIEAG